jgi:hypothetical protein
MSEETAMIVHRTAVTAARRRLGLLGALVGTLVLLPATAAHARTGGDAYLARLMTALDTCSASVGDKDVATLSRCVQGLAAPTPTNAVEVDLVRTFTNCLAAAADSDSMYPGVDPDEVNQCLADWGVY